jgi:hypothetical protein
LKYVPDLKTKLTVGTSTVHISFEDFHTNRVTYFNFCVQQMHDKSPNFGENSNGITNQSIHIEVSGDQAPPRATIFSGPISKDGLAANIEHPQSSDYIMLHVHNL